MEYARLCAPRQGLADLDAKELLILAGLAAADSFNTSTLGLIIVIILFARRPVGTGSTYVLGVVTTFYVLSLALYFGVSAFDGGIDTFILWTRRLLFGILAVALAYMGYQQLHDRPRKGIPTLPMWVNPYTGPALGALMTAADLPNAFPLFFALGKLLAADISNGAAVAILLAYTFIYALPALLILIGGLMFRDRFADRLHQLLIRMTTGVSKANRGAAALLFAGAVVCAYIATTIG